MPRRATPRIAGSGPAAASRVLALMLHFPRWQVITILVVCVLGVLLSLPNLFSEKTLESLPSWVPKRQVALGLDLQGGSHLLLEVNFGAAFAERMSGVVDGVRAKMRDARIGYTG